MIFDAAVFLVYIVGKIIFFVSSVVIEEGDFMLVSSFSCCGLSNFSVSWALSCLDYSTIVFYFCRGRF